MFTSEPSLIQRIERRITETPVIDTDSDLRPDRLSAPDLFAILGEPVLVAELMAVGMPPASLDPKLAADDRIHRVISYLARIRNTAAAWCFYRILRDLYDFYDPHVTESNAAELLDRVRSTGQNPDWGAALLRDRCQIQRVVSSASQISDGSNLVVHSVNLDPLLCPDFSAEVAGSGGVETYDRRLGRLLGNVPASASQFRKLLDDWIARKLTGAVRVSRLTLTASRLLARPDSALSAQALTAAAADKPLSRAETEELARFATWKVLDWYASTGATLQLVLGGESDGEGNPDHAPGYWNSGWTGDLARTLRHFDKARFDLLAGCHDSRRDAGALAARLPNVSVSGSWRHDFSAVAIAGYIERQAHVTPMTKLTGFASGASSAQWVYGKFQLFRKATASAFASLIEAGYYEEDEISPILRQILHDTPQSLYPLR